MLAGIFFHPPVLPQILLGFQKMTS